MAAPELAFARLRWARETHGSYRTAESFARAANVKGHYYRAHERSPDDPSKDLGLSYENAVAWADLLDVRWKWLLEGGNETPWREDKADPPKFSPEATSVAQKLDSLPEDQRKVKAEAIKALLTGTG